MILYKSEQECLKLNISTCFFQVATSKYCTGSLYINQSGRYLYSWINQYSCLHFQGGHFNTFTQTWIQFQYLMAFVLVYWIGTSIILANRCIPVQTYKFSCICLEDTSILLRKLEFNFGEQIREEDDVSQYIYYNSKLLAQCSKTVILLSRLGRNPK